MHLRMAKIIWVGVIGLGILGLTLIFQPNALAGRDSPFGQDPVLVPGEALAGELFIELSDIDTDFSSFPPRTVARRLTYILKLKHPVLLAAADPECDSHGDSDSDSDRDSGGAAPEQQLMFFHGTLTDQLFDIDDPFAIQAKLTQELTPEILNAFFQIECDQTPIAACAGLITQSTPEFFAPSIDHNYLSTPTFESQSLYVLTGIELIAPD